ncbi:M23 family metallopeptidase [Micromonospora sp. NBC_01699]|uniref:murein hydrolase activator EnvC family protein n=1 Tax=Micromonospora sp. NBC_01699 TaxID=2975984 RepID=UPI002E2B65D6|nr:M23 family metallopeptidase [Micromonospora sp. NBC_01699]
MRQRLSSESDRYRGRRRVPRPSRRRYGMVAMAALVGAGLTVAGVQYLPDTKSVARPALVDLGAGSPTAEVAARAEAAERASRSRARDSAEDGVRADEDRWRLPLGEYAFTVAYGVVAGQSHPGVDLSAAPGREFRAVHAGRVTFSGWRGGYGNSVVVDHGNGIQTLYGHASTLRVTEGQSVSAGDVLGLVGATGDTYGPRLHLEVHTAGAAHDPVPLLRSFGVDLELGVESVG